MSEPEERIPQDGADDPGPAAVQHRTFSLRRALEEHRQESPAPEIPEFSVRNADSKSIVAATALPPTPDDPLVMPAPPQPDTARRGWFGSRRQAPSEVDPQPMVDVASVSEAQAAAGRRAEGAHAEDASVRADAEMPAETAAKPVRAGRIGVLLVNLGTPDEANANSVRRYLRQFLSDPRVIERDSFVWQLALRGIILPLRPRIKARAYRAIWNKENNESPLKTVTRSQAVKLFQTLASIDDTAVVDWAMRYASPSIESRVRAMIADGCDRILVVPLYPQYSSATTASVCDEVFRVLGRIRNQPSVRVAPPYYSDPVYIEAISSSIEARLADLSFRPEVIIASFHGMPLEYVQKGDPYYRHCVATVALLRERLGMGEDKLLLTFQSRFGRAQWLQPYTNQTLRNLAKSGVRSVAVVTPGFAADCLETLEEIAIENARLFKKRGGKNFTFVPCLNDSERGMQVIREIAARELKGWL